MLVVVVVVVSEEICFLPNPNWLLSDDNLCRLRNARDDDDDDDVVGGTTQARLDCVKMGRSRCNGFVIVVIRTDYIYIPAIIYFIIERMGAASLAAAQASDSK